MWLCKDCCPNPHRAKSFGTCEGCGLKHADCGDCQCPPGVVRRPAAEVFSEFQKRAERFQGQPATWFGLNADELRTVANKLKEPIKVPKLNKHGRRAMTPEEKRAWRPEED